MSPSAATQKKIKREVIANLKSIGGHATAYEIYKSVRQKLLDIAPFKHHNLVLYVREALEQALRDGQITTHNDKFELIKKNTTKSRSVSYRSPSRTPFTENDSSDFGLDEEPTGKAATKKASKSSVRKSRQLLDKKNSEAKETSVKPQAARSESGKL